MLLVLVSRRKLLRFTDNEGISRGAGNRLNSERASDQTKGLRQHSKCSDQWVMTSLQLSRRNLLSQLLRPWGCSVAINSVAPASQCQFSSWKVKMQSSPRIKTTRGAKEGQQLSGHLKHCARPGAFQLKPNVKEYQKQKKSIKPSHQ